MPHARDPFAALEPFEPRRFVPAEADLGDWSAIEPLYDALEREAALPATDLYQWLLRRAELEDALDQEGARRLVLSTMYTEDAALEQAYLRFNAEIAPKVTLRSHRLDELYLAHPARAALPDECRMYDRVTANAAEIHRDENVPLGTQLNELDTQYRKVTGAQTVEWEGEQRTLQQLAPVLQETDRELRKRAWQAMTGRRLADAEALDLLFDRMLALRRRIADNAGFGSYRDYRFRELNRFDYTVETCREFHRMVEQVVLPLERTLDEQRRDKLGLERLRPWDMRVDPDQLPPLFPFETAEQLVGGCRRIFERIDPRFALWLDELDRRELLDLTNRQGKAPGGYQASLQEARLPFIFMNAVGLQSDVTTLLHEGGHAFHSFEVRRQPLSFNRGAPIEFAEVASMSMELLGADEMEVFLEGDELRRARRQQMERVVGTFPMIALGDAFQHWIYENPDHSRQARRDKWIELSLRFGSGVVDWSGLEQARAHQWQAILHFYGIPFYFIEYAMAQLGALQVWVNYRRDPAGAVAAYRRGLALGYSRPLPELFGAAGARFEFGPEFVGELFAPVAEELERLAG